MRLVDKLIILIATLNCILGPIDAYYSYIKTPIDWLMISICIIGVVFSIWCIGWAYKRETGKVIDAV